MTPKSTIRTLSGSTSTETERKLELAQRLRQSRVPDRELLDNLGLYLTRQNLSRINFIQKLYDMIIPVHGVIMEFGVRWGQNMALFNSLRGIYEPFNYNRRIIGFDTFEGFPSVAAEDGSRVKSGDYAVAEDWMQELDSLLDIHALGSPIPHKKKHELVVGDATQSLPTYLAQHPETVIALAYFDFDLYKPTRDCLEAIQPYLTKGSVLAFDELNTPEFPGETIALREVLGLSRYAIRRDASNPLTSYLVIE
jgi:hypothetical protein